jgi:2-deoxy-D-gluconate 3-dehydrogenase
MLKLFDLSGKTAIVTGASKGIGKSIAIGLASAGADLVIVSRSGLDDTEKKILETGSKCLKVYADLSDINTTKKIIIESTLKEFGKIDILVNNAGIQRRSPAFDYKEEDWDDIININLKSVFILSQSVAKIMKENGGGKIINMGSVLSFQGGVTVPAYAASKGGIAQLTKALANEWAPYKINVNAIAPGYIDTNMIDGLKNDKKRRAQILERIPAGRWGIPEEIAGGAVYLASNASNYVDGHILCIDGGWLSR